MAKKRSTTIFTRICIPLFIVMLLQSAIFYLVTVYGSVVSSLNSNAIDILTERVNNRQNELESSFTSQWANMSVYTASINELHESYAASETSPLFSDSDLKKRFLTDASDRLFTMLRSNKVNGVFLILTNSDSYAPVSADPQSYYGLCIRDYDLNSGYTDKEDLLLVRCPSSISAEMGCPMDSNWDALYSFDAVSCPGDFFYKPLEVAYANPGVSSDNLAYLCPPHRLGGTDRPVISYSIPLIAADGRIYGVLGVELTTEYLSGLLPSIELQGQGASAYMLVQYPEGSADYTIVAASGTLFQRCFGSDTGFTLDLNDTVGKDNALYAYTGKQELSVCLCFSPLTVYNRNTPFEKEIFALVGVVQRDALFSVSQGVRNSLLYVTGFALLIGLLGIFVVSHMLSRPVKRLGREVQRMGPNEKAQLEHINIREIDQLVDAIENQSHTINQSKVRTEFFSRMSHDMRTPMNAIIGFSSPEVSGDCDRAQLMENLGKINGSGKYLLGLINEVLDMTKIDSGRMELESLPFRMSALWSSFLPMVDELAEQRSVHFVKSIPPEDVSVRGDMQRLSQVFVNLLSNAVKFTPKGGMVALNVHQELQPDSLVALEIEVRDTGMGMSEEFQKKMYQPFVQEHPGKEGTGLGLSIAYQMVTLMGGAIDCESHLGRGTCFTIRLQLPVVQAADQTAAAKPQKSAEEISALLNGRQILLCEDHPLNQQIACRLLARQNIKVDVASNGQIGLDMFAASAPDFYDAVLMDIRMPVLNGIEATRAIRALDRPDAKRVPILAMTANAFQEDMDASAAAGMNAHLAKPIEPQKLYQALAENLSRK